MAYIQTEYSTSNYVYQQDLPSFTAITICCWFQSDSGSTSSEPSLLSIANSGLPQSLLQILVTLTLQLSLNFTFLLYSSPLSPSLPHLSLSSTPSSYLSTSSSSLSSPIFSSLFLLPHLPFPCMF